MKIMVAMSAGIRSIKSVENRKDNKMSEYIAEFLKNDEAKVEKIIKKISDSNPNHRGCNFVGYDTKNSQSSD